MSSRILDALAAELEGVTAFWLVSLLAFAVWRATGLREGGTMKAEPRDGGPDVADVADGPTLPTSGSVAPPVAPSASPRAAHDAGGPARKPRPTYNVILITVDTLRADLGFTDYPRPVTPNIDALAGGSVVYERAYAMASFTPKCLGPLLIGKYVSETERDYQHYTNFGPSNVFLAERVQAAGGRTVGAASHRYFGWKKGFDQGFDLWDTAAIPPNSVDNDPTITSGKLTDVAISALSSPNAGDIPVHPKVTKEPRSGPAEGRFFAWFHYLDPHLPYVAHEDAPRFSAIPAREGEPPIPRERAAYDGEVWYTDKEVGRLLRYIAAQPWASETAIIFTADHGEAFGEHSHWGHGRELWEPLVHVPLILHVPGAPPRRIAVKRSHVDVVPTVLELMNIPGDPALRGKSLLADLAHDRPDKPLEERDLYIDMPEGPYNEMRRAILYGPSPGMKLIDFGSGKYALFDLLEDPTEKRNLVGDRTRLAEGTAALSRVRSTIKELPPTR